MGFTDFVSRIPPEKNLPISHYDEESVVANIDKIKKAVYHSDNQRQLRNAVGSNLKIPITQDYVITS